MNPLDRERGNSLFVTTRPERHDWLMVSMALPLRMPWVTMAYTSRAPCSLTVAAALAS